jgi:hypothetical protein
MSLDLNTRIVTTTPYNIVDNDTVIFVNVVGPSSVILPANGIAVSNILQQANINSGLDDPTGLEQGHGRPECKAYQSFYIKDYSGNAKTNPITITSAGGKLIDGVSFALLNRGYAHIQVVYDGTNWKTIA